MPMDEMTLPWMARQRMSNPGQADLPSPRYLFTREIADMTVTIGLAGLGGIEGKPNACRSGPVGRWCRRTAANRSM
jgi:hypothetical protein